MKNLTLLMVALLSQTLVAAPTPEPVTAFKPGTRILFQGDSITDGNRGRNPDPNHILGHGYVFILAAKFGAAFPEAKLEFFNRGVSGNSVRAATEHAVLDALGVKADADSLLVIRNADGHLTGIALGARNFNGQPPAQADFEFDAPDLKQPAKFTPITAPTGFSWNGSGANLVPGYEASEN